MHHPEDEFENYKLVVEYKFTKRPGNCGVLVHVNGTLVNHGFNMTTTSGKIALHGEGVEVAFRKVELTPHGE